MLDIKTFVGIIISLCVLCFSIVTFLLTDISKPKNRYYVTIDKNTKFEEICKDYNVVEQKGELYILEDKKDNKYE